MTKSSGFGKRLRHERERLKLTQAEFSQHGGISDRVQQRYEKEQSQPDLIYLSKVATIGVDILYIITGQRTPMPVDSLREDEVRVVKNYNSADPADQQTANALLESLAKKKKVA